MKFSIQSLIWLLVIAGLVGAAVMALTPKAIEVETSRVERGDLELTVREDGITRIREKYTISAPVAGRISRIRLKSGDPVVGSKTLVAVIMPAEPAMLDARAKAQAQARVDQAAAAEKRSKTTAKQIKIDFELSQQNFERLKRLIDSKSVSQNEYDVARAKYYSDMHRLQTNEFDQEIATYELRMAEAALLQYSSADSTAGVTPFEILAPIEGNVLRVFQQSATVLSVGTPLIEVGDPNNLEIVIDVLSTDAVKIAPGAKLAIEHWGGNAPLTGTVRVVEPAAFTKVSSLGVEEQRVNVIADFDGTNDRLEALGDGYRIEARITIQKMEDVLFVPNSCLFRFEREWHVFTINESSRAELKPVQIGIQNETQTEIISGLELEEQVILYPSDKITDQSAVQPVD